MADPDALNRFQDLVDGVNAILWELSLPSWRFTFVSPQAERILGYPIRRWLTEDGFWAKILHPEDRDWAVRFCVEATHGAYDHHFEYRAIAADGRVVWLSDCIRVVKDDGGRPIRLQGVMLDVTPRHDAQERARELAHETGLRQQAEQALRLRDEVLAVVAHDLRNPVHTIAMSAAAMAELPLSELERTRYLRIIERSARNMDRLIGDLLDVHRKETGTFTIRREQIDPAGVLSELIETFTPRVAERRLTIASEFGPRLPPVTGDRDRLVQALTNVLSNAVKFTRPEGRITLRAEQAGPELRVAVENTGDGIPAADLPHVFDRFWQAKRVKGGGSGLGLYIAKTIVEAHGGRIWAESVEGEKCTFSIALPTAETASPPAREDTTRTRRA